MAMKKGMIPPRVSAARKFDVNRAGQVESVYQPLYDYQTYDKAGVTSMSFFQLPVGQAGKTLADTNMESAGSLPAPKEMLVTHIEVVYFPGSPPTAGSQHWDDMWTIFKSGYLDFFIGSKSYLIDGPVGKFSNSFRLGGAAAVGANEIGYAAFAGPLYEITPIKLVANQNFNVTLRWPTPVPTTGANPLDGKIGIILGGFQYRLSQ